MTDQLSLIITPRATLDGYERIDLDLPAARVGHVRCRFMSEKAIIYSITVFPEFQNHGYATAAVDLLKERFSVLVADRVRFTARGFWEKCGFTERPDGNWEYRAPVRVGKG